MRSPLFRRLRIIAIIIIAYILASISSNNIFLTGTPHFNMGLIVQMRDTPRILWNNSREYISRALSQRTEYVPEPPKAGGIILAPTSLSTYPPSDPNALIGPGYTQIKDGIYAKYDMSAKYIDIHILTDKQFVNREIVLAGKRVTVMMRGD